MAHNNAVSLTGVERTFRDDEFIITKTDAKGVITYANQIVMNLSGYDESELIGSQHNIFRHPEMPRCIFKFLWDNIVQGDEVLAYVINKCKNGDHYWVFAHVTASYDANGKIIGYLSARRSPEKEALDVIKPLYKALLDEENQHSSPKNGMEAGLNMLVGILKEKKISYGEFILSI